ncbi:beta-lactamase/transpeptidase-like protein [Auriculariales sp. MPI-PUGE-AT-0066]|nr:beta-lactamase/transpeptidase-like protein [Auriculariales sp. MPI-PUGE-AT-0066]
MSTIHLQTKLQQIVDNAVSGGLPGLTFGTLYRDESGAVQKVWASSGSLPLPEDGKSVELSPDTLLPIFSCVKLVVAIAVMQLVERGQIGLDDSVADILPELVANGIAQEDGSRSPLTSTVTVRMLLTHTAGLGYATTSRAFVAWYSKQSQEYQRKFPLAERGYDFPLISEPGKIWSYSYAIDWLGRLISRKTGLSLDSYIQEHISAPLGIELYFEQKSHVVLPQLGSLQSDSSVQWLGVFPLPPGQEPIGGHGGITSIRAFAEIVALLTTGGVSVSTGKRVLKQDSVDAMFHDQLGPVGIAYPAVQESANSLLILDDQAFPAGGVKKSFAIAGELNLNPLANGRRAGSVTWGGCPSIGGLYWRYAVAPSKAPSSSVLTAGIVCVSGTQILPFLHPRTLNPFLECEGEVVAALK